MRRFTAALDRQAADQPQQNRSDSRPEKGGDLLCDDAVLDYYNAR